MTLDLSLLPDGGVGWLDASGDHSDIVLSTSIRLARNVEGFAFTTRARDGERLRVLSQVRDAIAQAGSLADSVLVRVDELPSADRLLLHERHLVSKELAGLDAQHPVRSGAAVILNLSAPQRQPPSAGRVGRAMASSPSSRPPDLPVGSRVASPPRRPRIAEHHPTLEERFVS